MVRPVKYETPEDMQTLIDEYFMVCENSKMSDSVIHPTVTGLALALDMTREGLLFYCDKSDAFADTIKKAKTRVEAYIEQKLYGGQVTGLIFNLKNNFRWVDKTESAVDLTSKGQRLSSSDERHREMMDKIERKDAETT